jgi:hypothetical protein
MGCQALNATRLQEAGAIKAWVALRASVGECTGARGALCPQARGVIRHGSDNCRDKRKMPVLQFYAVLCGVQVFAICGL